jgi:hypothetical protein
MPWWTTQHWTLKQQTCVSAETCVPRGSNCSQVPSPSPAETSAGTGTTSKAGQCWSKQLTRPMPRPVSNVSPAPAGTGLADTVLGSNSPTSPAEETQPDPPILGAAEESCGSVPLAPAETEEPDRCQERPQHLPASVLTLDTSERRRASRGWRQRDQRRNANETIGMPIMQGPTFNITMNFSMWPPSQWYPHGWSGPW